MNILVIAPLVSEYKNFRKTLESVPHSNHYHVVQSGVGKANAAATVALELYGNPDVEYDLIAVIGYAGGSSRLKQGDFVIPCSTKYHDANCPSDIVPELTKEYSLEGSDNYIILTGDSFVTKDNIAEISSHSTDYDAIVFDMESASVCQIAEDSGIPVIVMKLISDIPSQSNNMQSFNEFVKTHSNFIQFLQYLESLNNV